MVEGKARGQCRETFGLDGRRRASEEARSSPLLVSPPRSLVSAASTHTQQAESHNTRHSRGRAMSSEMCVRCQRAKPSRNAHPAGPRARAHRHRHRAARRRRQWRIGGPCPATRREQEEHRECHTHRSCHRCVLLSRPLQRSLFMCAALPAQLPLTWTCVNSAPPRPA
jgi:hypothetical protein